MSTLLGLIISKYYLTLIGCLGNMNTLSDEYLDQLFILKHSVLSWFLLCSSTSLFLWCSKDRLIIFETLYNKQTSYRGLSKIQFSPSLTLTRSKYPWIKSWHVIGWYFPYHNVFFFFVKLIFLNLFFWPVVFEKTASRI